MDRLSLFCVCVLNFRTESMQSHWSVGILSTHCHEFSIWLKTCWNLMFGIYTQTWVVWSMFQFFSRILRCFFTAAFDWWIAHITFFGKSDRFRGALFRSLIWGQDLADYHRLLQSGSSQQTPSDGFWRRFLWTHPEKNSDVWGKLPLLLIRWVNHNCVPCHDGHDIMGSSYCCAQAALSQQSGE